MNKKLSKEEKDERFSALVRNDKKIQTLYKFYRPLSVELQSCFEPLFACEVIAEKPVFVPEPDPAHISFPKEEAVILKGIHTDSQFLVRLNGLNIKEAKELQELRESLFSTLAGVLNEMISYEPALIVTPLSDEDYLKLKWVDGIAVKFSAGQKKPFTLTLYPTAAVLWEIDLGILFGHNCQSEVRRLKRYDFARPDKFSKEQQRALSFIHYDFGNRISSVLSLSLNSTVNVAFVSTDQLMYIDYQRNFYPDAAIGLISMSPLNGEALIETDPILYSVILNRLFGFTAEGSDGQRIFSDIELPVLKNIVSSLLESVRESWKPLFEIYPRLLRIEEGSRNSGKFSENESLVCMYYEITIDGVIGYLNLSLPYSMLEPILGILGSASTNNISSRKTGIPESVKESLLKTSFKRTVRFDCVPLQDRNFSALSVNPDTKGRREYENVGTLHCNEDTQENVHEYERTERVAAFVSNFPMPFEIEFEDHEVDYSTYHIGNKQSSEIALCSCSDKTGALYLGENKITDIVLTKNEAGLSVKSIDDAFVFDALALEGMLLDFRFTVCAEMGVTYLPVETVLALGNGSIIQFDSLAGNPIEFFIEQPRYLIGKGEAVVMGDNIGMQLSEVTPASTGFVPDVHALFDVPVIRVRFILSRTTATLRSIIALEAESVMQLDGMIGETGMFVFDNGQTFQAEVVVIDEHFGARIVIAESTGTDLIFNRTVIASGVGSDKISFDVVRNAAPEDIVTCIRQERPQTIAAILAGLKRRKTSAVLRNLPVDIRDDVSKRLKKIGRISPMVLSEIAGVVNKKLRYIRR